MTLAVYISRHALVEPVRLDRTRRCIFVLKLTAKKLQPMAHAVLGDLKVCFFDSDLRDWPTWCRAALCPLAEASLYDSKNS